MPVATWRVVAASSGALAISVGFGRFSYGLLLPAMEKSNLGSYGEAGWLGTFNLGGYLVGVALVTALSRRVSPTALLRCGVGGVTLGLFGLAAGPSFVLLAIAMIVTGLAAAAVWLPISGVVAAAVTPARRGIALGFAVAGAGAGLIAADVIVTLIGHRFGATSWRAAWAVEGAIGLIALVFAVVAIPSRPAPLPGPSHLLDAFRTLTDKAAVLVSYGAYGVGYVIYTTYLVAALERSGGLSPGRAGGVFALLGAGSAIGGVILGRVSDRVGRRATIVAAQLCMIGCALALPTGSIAVALVSAAAFGVLMNGVGATIVAHLCDSIESSKVPAVLGVLTLVLGAAQCVGPPLGGFLIDASGGFRVAFVTAAVAFAIGAAGAWGLRRDAPGPERAAVAVGITIDVQREI